MTRRVRVPEPESVLHPMCWSFGCSVVAVAAAGVMVCLVELHEAKDPLIISEQFPFLEVVGPLFISGWAASLAVLFAVPLLLSGRLVPGLWIVPMSILLLWFVSVYDWTGLCVHGKPASRGWVLNQPSESVVVCLLVTLYFLIAHGVDVVTDRWTAREDAAEFEQRLQYELQRLAKKNLTV